jgi:hypothetical protein
MRSCIHWSVAIAEIERYESAIFFLADGRGELEGGVDGGARGVGDGHHERVGLVDGAQGVQMAVPPTLSACADRIVRTPSRRTR